MLVGHAGRRAGRGSARRPPLRRSGRAGAGPYRPVIFCAAFALLGAALGSGVAAAHNPACHQTAGTDGPHYADDGPASDTAFSHNPTLGGAENPALGGEDSPWKGGCSAGNSQSPNAD